MKNHLRRIASPRTWVIARKEGKFVTKPNGSHQINMGLPLGVILRDILHLASTMKEIKKMLNNNEILVDGKRRKDHRLIVGLFDMVAIPQLKKYYRLIINAKGKLQLIEITAEESLLKPCKIIGKRLLPHKKVQYNLHDGKNILLQQEARVGDTLLLQLPELKVKSHFPLTPGATIYLMKGRHNGDSGRLVKVEKLVATYEKDGEKIETSKEYIFVLGEKESCISLGGSK